MIAEVFIAFIVRYQLVPRVDPLCGWPQRGVIHEPCCEIPLHELWHTIGISLANCLVLDRERRIYYAARVLVPIQLYLIQIGYNYHWTHGGKLSLKINLILLNLLRSRTRVGDSDKCYPHMQYAFSIRRDVNEVWRVCVLPVREWDHGPVISTGNPLTSFRYGHDGVSHWSS